MVFLIKATNPSEAWFKAAKHILQNGKKIGNLKEVIHLLVEIDNPTTINEKIDNAFKEISSLGKKSGSEWVEWGIGQLSETRFTTKWSGTYFSRLASYRGKINQIKYVIDTLKRKPRSKQLFCTAFDPEIDIQPTIPYSPRMPCLTVLDFKDREEKLNLFAFFRSHDFGRKAYGNYIGLGKLLEKISKESNRNIGKLICFSSSAHIRLSELKEIEKVIQKLQSSLGL